MSSSSSLPSTLKSDSRESKSELLSSRFDKDGALNNVDNDDSSWTTAHRRKASEIRGSTVFNGKGNDKSLNRSSSNNSGSANANNYGKHQSKSSAMSGSWRSGGGSSDNAKREVR